MEILFATTNEGKLREVKEMLSPFCNVLSLKDKNINIEVVEDGKTFEENAIKKAKEIHEATGFCCLADDSGLEIDFLNKAPGIYSARFLGENTPQGEKNLKIIEMLKDVPKEKRTARFICCMAFCDSDGNIFTKTGSLEGEIAFKPEGENGFGYDPIFFVKEFNKNLAELPKETKNEISHRRKALEQIKEMFNAI